MDVIQNIENKIEHQRFEFKEVKALSEDNEYFTFGGYASVYGNMDSYTDVMEPGCFDESLKTRTPILLWAHKDCEPVGVFVEIRSDERGLFVSGKMPKADTFVTGRVIPQIKIGSVRGLSIGFICQGYYFDDQENRHIVQCELLEISLVGIPSNKESTITEFKKLQIDEDDNETKLTELMTRHSVEIKKMLADIRATKFLME